MATAAEPAKKRHFHWLRFSTRTLLLLTAAFAVWLGIHTERARRQKMAVEAVYRLGGSVVYDYQGDPRYGELVTCGHGPQISSPQPPGPAWLRNVFGIDYVSTVTGIRCFIDANSDNDLSFLNDLPDVQSLYILGYDESRISEYGTRALIAVDLGDEALARVGRLANLKWLTLEGVVGSDSGIGQLHNLRHLESATVTVTREHVDCLATLEDLASLEELTLVLAPPVIADGALQYMRAPGNLRSIEIRSGQISDAGMAHVAKLTNLEVLWIPHSQVTDAGLRHLAGLKKLKHLCLSHSKIEGPGLAHLADLDQLEQLILTDTYVDCRSLEHLEGSSPTWPTTLTVSVSGTYFPDEYNKRLERQIPKLRVDPVDAQNTGLLDLKDLNVRE